MLRDATLTSFLEVLNENEIPYELNKADNVLTMKDTGSRILLRAVDEFERLRGTNLAWFGLDELTYTQEGAWLRLEGRLRDPKAKRHCGFAVWTPKGFDWVYRQFMQNSGGSGYETILAKPFENRFLLDQVPDFYERLKCSYDENFFRQEVLGDYLNQRAGWFTTRFGGSRTCSRWRWIETLPVFWAVDFNVDPMCSVVVQIIAAGRDSGAGRNCAAAGDDGEGVRGVRGRFGVPKMGVVIYGDASGAAMQTTGFSDYEMIRSSSRGGGARSDAAGAGEQSAGAGAGGAGECEAAECAGGSAAVCGSEVQGTDRGFRAGCVCGRHDADRQGQGPASGRTYRMRWGM